MSDASGDDQDSRIASVGIQRTRGTRSASRSNHSSREPPSKRQRRIRNKHSPDVQDFVPRGASFSANSLEVDDPDSTSSSGSEGESDSDSDSNSEKGTEESHANVHVGSAPTLNWNKTGRSVIRTSLRSRQDTNMNTAPGLESAAEKKFEAVNGKYWCSRSASVSEGGEEEEEGGRGGRGGDEEKVATANKGADNIREEGEVDEDKEDSVKSQSLLSGDSDDSESLDSEADDSIMLNIGSKGQSRDQNGVITISDDDSDEDDDYDPESLPLSQEYVQDNDDIFDTGNGIMNGSATATESKKSALLRFAQKYSTTPSILADLNREDMELQARSIFYDGNINEINLQLPIMCMECLQEGHLAEVCPMKECVHCSAWNQHQSTLCPEWRRCQRCRERGHDHNKCASALKGSASEIPCDLCGSSDHLELDCDFLWKLPRQDTSAAPVLISISCAHCTSNRHLIGDCPSLTKPLPSSTFTLRGIDPNIITNINSVVNARRGGGRTGPSGGQRGMKIRGRADHAHARSPSSDSDDMMARSSAMVRGGKKPSVGGNRNAIKGNINIRIGNNAGKNNNTGPPPLPSARDYRDRDDPFPRNGNGRQRSMSPGRDRSRSNRGRGWQPLPPRSPPRGQGRPPGPPRPGRGGGGGGGRGGKRGGGGDAYRPLPSAAKKAWDRYRL